MLVTSSQELGHGAVAGLHGFGGDGRSSCPADATMLAQAGKVRAISLDLLSPLPRASARSNGRRLFSL